MHAIDPSNSIFANACNLLKINKFHIVLKINN